MVPIVNITNVWDKVCNCGGDDVCNSPIAFFEGRAKIWRNHFVHHQLQSFVQQEYGDELPIYFVQSSSFLYLIIAKCLLQRICRSYFLNHFWSPWSRKTWDWEESINQMDAAYKPNEHASSEARARRLFLFLQRTKLRSCGSGWSCVKNGISVCVKTGILYCYSNV